MEIGDRLDRYIVERALGEGGMATVYLARHESLRSLHALKVLRIDVPSIKQRLLTEGRVQAALRHPNIVAVTDVLDRDGVCALVMEYVDGPTLDAWIVDESVTRDVDTVLGLFRGIALGVAAAHRAGLVHRDLKPDNVLLASSNVGVIPKVTDFGLVKVVEGSSTRSGVLMGTPEYMSPEQVRDSADVDARTDLWALGVMLYEMLSEVVPFEADEVHEVYSLVVKGDFVPLRELRPDVPEAVEAVVHQLLAKDPDDRIQTAEEVVARLFPDGRPVSHRPALTQGQLIPTHDPPPIPEVPTGVVIADVTAPMEPISGVRLVEPGPRVPPPVALSLGVAAGMAVFFVLLGLAVVVTGLPQVDDVPVEPPPPAPVVVEAPAVREVRVTATLPVDRFEVDGAPRDFEGETAVLSLPHGEHELFAERGRCDEADRGCGNACPPGCASVVQTVRVEAGEGPQQVELPLQLGEPEPVPVPVPAPAPPPAPVAPKTGSVVTASAYASWLADHPEWGIDEAVRTGRAAQGYLRKWSPDPPAGPLTHVPWSAAEAYCASRGGLAGLEDPPLTWDWQKGVQIEWRSAGGKPGFRQYDGVTSTANPGNRSNAVTGVRCRR